MERNLSLVKVSPELRRELDEFSRFAIYAPQTAIMRGLAVDNRVVEPLGLTGSGLAAAVNFIQKNIDGKLLDQIMEIIWKPGWTNQIQTGPFNPTIAPSQVRSEGTVLYMRDRHMRAERNMLSAFDASEGTLYLIFVATLLGHPETPNVFALDNVDGTLNPRLVRMLTAHIIKVVCSNMMHGAHQVFMTSHHPSSLDSFDIYNEDHRVFVCSRIKQNDAVQGSTKFKPLKPPKDIDKDQWNILHGARNLSELFLNNRIPDAL